MHITPEKQAHYDRLMAGHDRTTKRVCHRCETVKSILAYSRQSTQPDGLRLYCRQCARTPVRIVTVTEKECSRCRFVKPINLFGMKKDALDQHQPYCSHCRHHYSIARQETHLARQTAPPLKERWCERCQTTKPANQFYKAMRWADGLNTTCITCLKAYRDQPEIKAAMSRRSALREEHPPGVYTAEDEELALAYRVATINDPCYRCGTTTGRMSWIHHRKQRDGGRDVWHNLRRACHSCLRYRHHTYQTPPTSLQHPQSHAG